MKFNLSIKNINVSKKYSILFGLFFSNMIVLNLKAETNVSSIDTTKPFFYKDYFNNVLNASGANNGSSLGSIGSMQRDGSEQEMTYKLSCDATSGNKKISNEDSVKIQKKFYKLLSKDNYDRFRKFSKCKICEALSISAAYSNSIDGSNIIAILPWDKQSHALRENLKYLPITIETERVNPPIFGLPIKLSYGADLMDDIYFDSDDFVAFKNNFGLRARKRWDSAGLTQPASMRRILYGLKNTLPVDPVTGLKVSLKIDDRFDLPTAVDIKTTATNTVQGYVGDGNNKKIIPSVYRLYTQLAEKGALNDQQGYEKVLQLKPKTFLRSLRLRFHYGTMDNVDTRMFFEFGKKVLEKTYNTALNILGNLPPGAPAENAILLKIIRSSENLLDTKKYFESKGYDWVKLSKIVESSPTYNQFTESDFNNFRTALEMYSQDLHKIGNYIERNAKFLAQLNFNYDSKNINEKKLNWFKRFLSEKQNALIRNAVMPQAAKIYSDILENGFGSNPNLLADFNAFGNNYKSLSQAQSISNEKILLSKDFADFADVSAQDLENLKMDLKFLTFDEGGRQIEAAGTALLQIWFQHFYYFVMDSTFSSYNLFIDTIDFVGIYKAESFMVDEYDSNNPKSDPVRKVLNFDEITNNHLITEDSMENSLIGSYFSNDVQLELGQELPFIKRKEKFKAAGQDTKNVDWILENILSFQKTMSKVKRIQIQEQITKEAYSKLNCSKWSWKPTDLPKGETSLKLISNKKL